MNYKSLIPIPWIIFIAYYSIKPIEVVIAGFSISNYILHFMAYALLAFLCFKFYGESKYTIPIIFIYGVLLEIVQLYVPGRICSMFDALVDGSGAILGGLIWDRIKRK